MCTTDTTVNSALVKEDGDRQVPIYYTSKVILNSEMWYAQVEKLALTLCHIRKKIAALLSGP